MLGLGTEAICLIQDQHLEPSLPLHVDRPALSHVLHMQDGFFTQGSIAWSKLAAVAGVWKEDTVTTSQKVLIGQVRTARCATSC